jgi:hypothetical protein
MSKMTEGDAKNTHVSLIHQMSLSRFGINFSASLNSLNTKEKIPTPSQTAITRIITHYAKSTANKVVHFGYPDDDMRGLVVSSLEQEKIDLVKPKEEIHRIKWKEAYQLQPVFRISGKKRRCDIMGEDTGQRYRVNFVTMDDYNEETDIPSMTHLILLNEDEGMTTS